MVRSPMPQAACQAFALRCMCHAGRISSILFRQQRTAVSACSSCVGKWHQGQVQKGVKPA